MVFQKSGINKDMYKRQTRNKPLTNVDYKYTGECNVLCGILGRAEELNNYGRWETHEGNAAITGVDEIRGLESHTSPIQIHSSDYGVISGDRLENSIAREQHKECNELQWNRSWLAWLKNGKFWNRRLCSWYFYVFVICI